MPPMQRDAISTTGLWAGYAVASGVAWHPIPNPSAASTAGSATSPTTLTKLPPPWLKLFPQTYDSFVVLFVDAKMIDHKGPMKLIRKQPNW